MKSTVVDESLSSMNQQFCSRENQLLQLLQQNEKSTSIQRFCLTLLGEARLWYDSLEPVNVHWQGIQNLFGQQYFKILGNNYFTHGDPLNTMRIQKKSMFMLLTLGK